MQRQRLVVLKQDQYTALAGGRTITLSGIFASLNITDIELVWNKTQDIIYFKPGEVNNCTMSGGVITISGAYDALAVTDEIIIKAWIEEVSSIETAVNDSNKANATVTRAVVHWGDYGFKTGSIHVKLVAGTADDTVTLTLWASNNTAATGSADTNWVDVSSDILKAASVTANNATTEELYIIDLPTVVDRFMIKVVYAYTGGVSAANSAVVKIMKSS
jgi:hypothetical protein